MPMCTRIEASLFGSTAAAAFTRAFTTVHQVVEAGGWGAVLKVTSGGQGSRKGQRGNHQPIRASFAPHLQTSPAAFG